MTFTGIVRGNTIVLDTPPDLPDGTRVSVELTPLPPKDNPFWGIWGDNRKLVKQIKQEVLQDRECICLRTFAGESTD